MIRYIRSSYDLNSRGSINKNTAIVSGPGSPDLIRECRSCAIPGIPSGDGWGHPLCHLFCLQTVRAQVWPDRSKLSETLTFFFLFYFFFHINKGAYKTSDAQAGLDICCSNVSKANFS